LGTSPRKTVFYLRPPPKTKPRGSRGPYYMLHDSPLSVKGRPPSPQHTACLYLRSVASRSSTLPLSPLATPTKSLRSPQRGLDLGLLPSNDDKPAPRS